MGNGTQNQLEHSTRELLGLNRPSSVAQRHCYSWVRDAPKDSPRGVNPQCRDIKRWAGVGPWLVMGH